MLFEIAGNNLQNIQALASAPNDIQQKVTRALSIELLAKWNHDCAASSALVTPQELLKQWLGYRLRPADGGTMHDFVMTHHQLDSSTPCLTWSGRLYPNPLHFMSHPELSCNAEPITAISGRLHGDLRADNVCTSVSAPRSATYFLIDFALYEGAAPIFYDHAYLELSCLLRECADLGTQRWTRLIESISSIEQEADIKRVSLDNVCVGVAGIVASIRHSCRSWIVSAHRTRQSSLQSQYVLARVAAGLNFVNKRGLGEEDRRRAFFYSACALKRYFETNHLPLDNQTSPLVWGCEKRPQGGERWEQVWSTCDYFDAARNTFVLVCNISDGISGELERFQALARVPWSLVVDLNPNSATTGLLKHCRHGIEAERGFHLAVAFREDPVDVNFNRATLWLMARGYAEWASPPGNSLTDWRRNYAETVRAWFQRLRDKVLPKPIKLFVLTDSTDDRFETRTWEFADEALQSSLTTIWVSRARPNLLEEGSASFQHFATDDLAELALELSYGLGTERVASGPRVPRRVQAPAASDEVLRELVTLDVAASHSYIEEDFQIFGTHLVAVKNETADSEGGFLRGSEVSCFELDAHVDVPRDAYLPVRRAVEERLNTYDNAIVRFEHNPGAGGTTVAKRLAWDMKELFPTTILRRFSKQSGDRLASLYHLTGLPILVVAEASAISQSELDELDFRVRSLNCRCVILHVARHPKPGGALGLVDPMHEMEAPRFLTTYSGVVDRSRAERLSELTYDNRYRKYRSPFFYGLFAFEDEFVHVATFVSAHLDGLSDFQKVLLDYLALIACYSQSNHFSIFEAAVLCCLDGSRTKHIVEVLGQRAERLVIQMGAEVKIIHPTMAREVLRQLSPSSQQGENQWRGRLHDIATALISDLAQTVGPHNDRAKDLLTQLLILRTQWGDGAFRGLFAPLILDMSSDESQALVFQELTERFPGEAHFWNHRGRHSNLILKENYQSAEALLKKAIELEPNDGFHYHSLGMVYRREVERRLKDETRKVKGIKGVAAAVRGIAAIREVFELAEIAFSDALRMMPDSDYPFVTHLQLILETVETVLELAGLPNAQRLVATEGVEPVWLAEKLSRADDLLEGLKRLDAQDAESEFAIKCHSRLRGLYGDFEGMLTSLQSLLARSDADKVSTRRLMASAVARRSNGDWIKMPQEEIRRIFDLSDMNISAGSENGRDFLTWLRAYRKLPEFDPNVAISKMSTWASYREPIDAYYYLYILQFIKWYRGLSDDLARARDALQKCYALYGVRGRPWSYEWLSTEQGRFPVIHYNDLGPWEKRSAKPFYRRKHLIHRAVGMIVDISGPQSGLIEVRRAISPQRQPRIHDQNARDLAVVSMGRP